MGIGFTSDVRTLKESGAVSVAELREFLKSLKTRNPQEVIGIVSSNLLVQSLGLACVITAVFMNYDKARETYRRYADKNEGLGLVGYSYREQQNWPLAVLSYQQLLGQNAEHKVR